jgi:tetratricopeptide (TPR) repeat protein
LQYIQFVIRWAVVVALAGASASPQQQSPESLFAAAIELRDSGKQVEALREFRRAARRNPKLRFVHREIGLILLDRRDFGAAAAAFQTAAEQDPDDRESRYNFALSLANAGRKQQGLRELRKLVQRWPDWGLAWFGFGHVYAMQGRAADAEQAFRRAVRLDGQLARAHFELGKILEEKGDLEGAINAFSAGIRVAPDSAAARFRLAKVLRQAGRHEEAAQQFGATRELRDQRGRGEQAAGAYTRGLALLKQGQYTAAISELTQALELRPDFPETRTALAEAYEQRGMAIEQDGKLAEAAAEYQSAMEYAPSPELANHIGVLLAKLGRTAEAIAMFRRALADKPDYAAASINLQHALELNSPGP